MATKALAVIAGAGPGTGQAVALRFAKAYNIILLSRSEKSYSETVQKIKDAGGSAHGIPTDITDEESVRAAFKQMDDKFPDSRLAAGVYNVGNMDKVAPFLELKTGDLRKNLEAGAIGAFNFAQSCLSRMLESVKTLDTNNQDVHHPTLLFTGATASIKGSAKFAAFSPGKWALRSMTQSLSKEFGPQGIHVSHIIMDGLIDTPATKDWKKGEIDSKLDPAAIAETYFQLHQQPRTTWTWELDLRPFNETW